MSGDSIDIDSSTITELSMRFLLENPDGIRLAGSAWENLADQFVESKHNIRDAGSTLGENWESPSASEAFLSKVGSATWSIEDWQNAAATNSGALHSLATQVQNHKSAMADLMGDYTLDLANAAGRDEASLLPTTSARDQVKSRFDEDARALAHQLNDAYQAAFLKVTRGSTWQGPKNAAVPVEMPAMPDAPAAPGGGGGVGAPGGVPGGVGGRPGGPGARPPGPGASPGAPPAAPPGGRVRTYGTLPAEYHGDPPARFGPPRTMSPLPEVRALPGGPPPAHRVPYLETEGLDRVRDRLNVARTAPLEIPNGVPINGRGPAPTAPNGTLPTGSTPPGAAPRGPSGMPRGLTGGPGTPLTGRPTGKPGGPGARPTAPGGRPGAPGASGGPRRSLAGRTAPTAPGGARPGAPKGGAPSKGLAGRAAPAAPGGRPGGAMSKPAGGDAGFARKPGGPGGAPGAPGRGGASRPAAAGGARPGAPGGARPGAPGGRPAGAGGGPGGPGGARPAAPGGRSAAAGSAGGRAGQPTGPGAGGSPRGGMPSRLAGRNDPRTAARMAAANGKPSVATKPAIVAKELNGRLGLKPTATPSEVARTVRAAMRERLAGRAATPGGGPVKRDRGQQIEDELFEALAFYDDEDLFTILSKAPAIIDRIKPAKKVTDAGPAIGVNAN